MGVFGGISTRVGAACPSCGGEAHFVDPMDVLAERPARVEVLCVECGKHGTTFLVENDRDSLRPWQSVSLFPPPPRA